MKSIFGAIGGAISGILLFMATLAMAALGIGLMVGLLI